jgi:hypothetical protein
MNGCTRLCSFVGLTYTHACCLPSPVYPPCPVTAEPHVPQPLPLELPTQPLSRTSSSSCPIIKSVWTGAVPEVLWTLVQQGFSFLWGQAVSIPISQMRKLSLVLTLSYHLTLLCALGNSTPSFTTQPHLCSARVHSSHVQWPPYLYLIYKIGDTVAIISRYQQLGAWIKW